METEDIKPYVVPALIGVGVLGALYYFTRGEEEVASLPILGGMAKSKALQLTDEQVVQIVKNNIEQSIQASGTPEPQDADNRVPIVGKDATVEVKILDKFEVGVPSRGEYFLFRGRDITPAKTNPTHEEMYKKFIVDSMTKTVLAPSNKVFQIGYTISHDTGSVGGNFSVVLTDDGKVFVAKPMNNRWSGTLLAKPDAEPVVSIPEDMKALLSDPQKKPIIEKYWNDQAQLSKTEYALCRPVPVADLEKFVSTYMIQGKTISENQAYFQISKEMIDQKYLQASAQAPAESSRSTERQGRKKKKTAEAMTNPTSSIVPVLQFAAGVGVILWASSLLRTGSR